MALKITAAFMGLLASAYALPSPNVIRTPTISARSPSITPFVGHPANDYSCKSAHNPVIMLHGLSADEYVDLNVLQYWLNERGFCTFTLTYGAHTLFPLVGGLKEMADSAGEIAEFVKQVKSKTGASKVDLVGHSEGGVMALLVPLIESGIPELLGHTVSLGPAVHGAKYYGLTDLAWVGGDLTFDMVETAINTLGAPAIADMATGGNVYNIFQKATGHIVQAGVKASIVMSRSDTLVAPEVSIIDEAGVRNLYVQDYCPDDKVGHAGLAWDQSVWGIIYNELLEDYSNKTITCGQGLGV